MNVTSGDNGVLGHFGQDGAAPVGEGTAGGDRGVPASGRGRQAKAGRSAASKVR